MNSATRKCRTCLDGTKGLQCLTKPAVINEETTEPRKSYADLLKEVVHIMTQEDTGETLPMLICICCARKLKAAYIYIQQARRINEGLKAKSREYNGDRENVTEYLEVKMETLENYHDEEEQELPKEEGSLAANDNKSEILLEDNKLKASKSNSFGNLKKNELVDAENIKRTNSKLILKSLNKTSEQEDKTTFIKTKIKVKTKIKCNESIDVEARLETPLKCNDCEKIFENLRQLRRHQNNAHIPEHLQVQCLQCEAKFARQHNMLAHMRLFHKVDNFEEFQNTIDNTLAISTTTHKKRFLCTLCGLTFNSQYCLNIHFRRHTGEKPYKCEFCDRAYIRLCDVQVHRRSHTGEKPYKCTFCEKAFSRANKLKIHIRSHTNERPYKCTQCNKAFKQSKHLNEHKRTHTGERPYRCGICQSTFTQSNSLRSHQLKQKHMEVENMKGDISALTSQQGKDINKSDCKL